MSEADHARVSAAVQAAEAQSAGEIVTILADRSDDYADTPLGWASAVALLTLAAVAAIPHRFIGLVESQSGGWGAQVPVERLLGVLAALAAIMFAITWLIVRSPALRVRLTSATTRATRVRARAITCFKVGAERRTHGRTGILIYLSMRERRAEIVADEAITALVGAETWGDAMAAMLIEIRAGRVADGMIAAVGKVGDVLALHFPRAADDTNELPDRLIEV
jgi:putative membrane protein